MSKSIVFCLCAAALLGCRDNAQEASRKADEQRIEADYRAREEQRAADEKARNQKISADTQGAEHSLSVAKEKSDERSNVQEWLNSLEKYLAELQRGTKDSKLGDDQRALQAFKETLQGDLGDIDRVSDADWASVKTRIDKDIDDTRKRISQLSLVAKVKA
jgi:hypothetical protein